MRVCVCEIITLFVDVNRYIYIYICITVDSSFYCEIIVDSKYCCLKLLCNFHKSTFIYICVCAHTKFDLFMTHSCLQTL